MSWRESGLLVELDGALKIEIVEVCCVSCGTCYNILIGKTLIEYVSKLV
jgi:hypothetical protein